MIEMSRRLGNLMEELKKTNSETFYHCLKVKKLTFELLHMTNANGITHYNKEQFNAICKGALLHDIGKLYVKNFVLTKDSYLTDAEREHIKAHTNAGYEAIKDELEGEELEIVGNICLYHHERCDGGGYHHKTADELPMYVQIVSVADVYDALHSDRVYRDGMSPEDTLKMITDGKCGAFDPALVAVLAQYVFHHDED